MILRRETPTAYNAECLNRCDWEPDNVWDRSARRVLAEARRHVRETGHEVRVGTESAIFFKIGDRA